MKKLHIDRNNNIIYIITIVFVISFVFVLLNIKTWTINLVYVINNKLFVNKGNENDLQIEKLNLYISELKQNPNIIDSAELIPLQYIMVDNNIYNKLLLKSNTSNIINNGITVWATPNLPIGVVDNVENNIVSVKLFSNKDFQYEAIIDNNINDNEDNNYIDIIVRGDGVYSANFELNLDLNIDTERLVYMRHNTYPIGKIISKQKLDKENSYKYNIELYYKNNQSSQFYVVK